MKGTRFNVQKWTIERFNNDNNNKLKGRDQRQLNMNTAKRSKSYHTFSKSKEEKSGPVILVEESGGRTVYIPAVLTIHCGQFGCYAIVSQDKYFLKDYRHFNLKRCRVRTVTPASNFESKQNHPSVHDERANCLSLGKNGDHSLETTSDSISDTIHDKMRCCSLRNENIKTSVLHTEENNGNEFNINIPKGLTPRKSGIMDMDKNISSELPNSRKNIGKQIKVPENANHGYSKKPSLQIEALDGEGAPVTCLVANVEILKDWIKTLKHCVGDIITPRRRHTIAAADMERPKTLLVRRSSVQARANRNSMSTLVEED